MSTFNRANYPDAPGFKARDTARDAAKSFEPKVGTLRYRVLRVIRYDLGPSTPEEVADYLGEPLANIRPRCSELAAKDLIIDGGQRRRASGGKSAIVWQARMI